MPSPDAYSDIDIHQAGEIGLSTPAAAPPLSFFDKVKLSWKQAGADHDWGFNQVNWRESALDEIVKGLRAKGIEPAVTHPEDDNEVSRKFPIQRGESYDSHRARVYQALLDQVAAVRRTDPNFLPDYATVTDKPSLDKLLVTRRQAALADVAQRAPDGLGFAGFVGSLGHGAIDPASWIGIGGEAKVGLSVAQQLLRSSVRNATANVAFTAATEPLVRRDATTLGQQRGFGDFLGDLGMAAVTGGALGGVVTAGVHAPRAIGERLFPSIVRQHDADAFGKALTNEIARTALPSELKSFDPTVARIFGDIVPPEQRTPDEQAAMHAVERDAETHATSPFLTGPEGSDHHSQWLDQAMQAMSSDEPALRGPVKGIAREAIAGGTADASGARFPGREQLKARIHSAEGPHGGRNLLGSNALGPYQFEPRTWVNLFRRRYPGDKRSFDEIAALREDPHLNDVMINDLIAENSAALRNAGLDGEDARNLYLAHVLGSDKAVSVLRARGETRLGDLLPESYFAKNPFKPDWTANQMRAWADKRMGGSGAVQYAGQTAFAPEEAAGAEPIPTGRFDVEAMFNFGGIEGDRPVLRPDLFGSPEEHAAAQVRFERGRDAVEGYAPVASRDELFSPYEHFDGLKRYRGTVTAEAIGEALGISPDQARKAVQTMQSLSRNSPFIMARERGAEPGSAPSRIMRRPPARPKGLIEFLASRGGIHDAGGDLRAMDADVGRKFRKALINNETGMGLDDALGLAIDHDYFPELNHIRLAGGNFADKPDVQVLLDAIDAELRGEKRLGVDEQLDAEEAARRAFYGEQPEPEVDHAARPAPVGVTTVGPANRERMLERVGHNYESVVEAAGRRGIELPDDMLVDASDLIDAGMEADEALANAALADVYRTLDGYAGETGAAAYAIDPDERFADDPGLPEQRGAEPGDRPVDTGGGRSARVAQIEGESRARLAQLADDPARAEFGDPVGPAAEAQADSLIHDLEMAAEGGTIRAALDRKDRQALRLRWLGEQEKKLGLDAAQEKLRAAELADAEPWLDPAFLLETYRDDPDAAAHILDAIAEHQMLSETKFRLDEEGGESDLKSILDEIDQAQKAAATMRDCLKPKGGGE